ncbi:MAG: hypothetical protein G01um101416_1050 [Microgenomates group bacterium Gr01-1014_16]|nr:MAG: hypothetical protein G01um101416_1050 [Microgenomates group bacterium Gr01-1014_16]
MRAQEVISIQFMARFYCGGLILGWGEIGSRPVGEHGGVGG